MSIYLINQPAGLGDIIYCQKIAKHFIAKGHTIKWPITNQYEWLSDYIQVKNMIFLPEGEYSHDIKLDLETASQKFPGYHMDAKYNMVGLNGEDWVDYFQFNRNLKKEEELFNLLKLTDDMKYNLVCDTYATPPNTITKNFDEYIDNDLPNIRIDFLTGFTPFDWCKVIEKATNLYLIDTCFTWIIEKLNVNAENMCLFSRSHPNKGTSLKSIHLFKQKWNLI